MPSFSDLDSWDSAKFEAARQERLERRYDSVQILRMDLELLTSTIASMLARLEDVEKACRAKKV